jgi:transcriptional regulator with XRE-family HTH domain
VTLHDPAAIAPEMRARLAQLGVKVREQREGLGLSMRAVGRETGLSFATISRVEAGDLPDLRSFLVLARWVGLPLAWFDGDEAAR